MLMPLAMAILSCGDDRDEPTVEDILSGKTWILYTKEYSDTATIIDWTQDAATIMNVEGSYFYLTRVESLK